MESYLTITRKEILTHDSMDKNIMPSEKNLEHKTLQIQSTIQNRYIQRNREEYGVLSVGSRLYSWGTEI